MDITTTIQIYITWTLLSLLVTWMVIFAWLALRPETEKKQLESEKHKISQPIPIKPALQMMKPVQEATGEMALERSVRYK